MSPWRPEVLRHEVAPRLDRDAPGGRDGRERESFCRCQILLWVLPLKRVAREPLCPLGTWP